MSSRMQLPKEYRDAVQDVLNYAFKDTSLTPDDVESMRIEAKMVPFPRDLPYCKCRRCTSPLQEWSIPYYNVMLETTQGPFYGTLPGPKDAFAHPKESSQ